MRTYILVVFVVAMLLGGCSAPSTPTPTMSMGSMGGAAAAVTVPDNLDLAAAEKSKLGLFTVSYTSDLDPVTINKLHTWMLHVAAADGQPLDGAAVTIDGGMPQHNHGLPTQPIVTPIGNGDYRVEGMKFQMPGWWTVTVTVTDTAGTKQEDSAMFNLMLQ